MELLGRGVGTVVSSLSRVSSRLLHTTIPRSSFKVVEQEEGDTTVVRVVETSDDGKKVKDKGEECSLCAIPVKVTYKDVLILEQFMREDGTVLPKQLTGLCNKQQLHLERCVMQAHWSGLFPDRTIPDFDRAGYKRFKRYWNDSMDMYRLREKKLPGTWFYIKRYPSKLHQTRAPAVP